MTQVTEEVGDSVLVQQCDVPLVDGPGAFARVPMTVEDMTALRGVVAYTPPSPEHAWLTLRLADGVSVQVAPTDDTLSHYLIEPADDFSAGRGVRPAFLALWAAYRLLGKLALEALERATNGAGASLAGRIAGLDVIEVVAKDHTLPAIRFLVQLAEAGNNRVRDGVLTAAVDVSSAA